MTKFSIIFDMDGVIVNNSEYHEKAWNVFCNKYEIELIEDEKKQHIFGTTNKTALEYIFKRELTTEEVIMYGDEKEELYRQLYQPHIKLANNLKEFLDTLKDSKITLAIATSADNDNVEFVMENTGIREYFSEIVNSDQIVKGKPDPEIYLETAKRINKETKECIVIEDSLAGIEAGKKAGMKVIAITSTHKREELNEADLIIDDFSELTIDIISSILKKIETKRLMLTPISMDDKEFILQQFSDKIVTKYLYDQSPFTTIDEAIELIRFYNHPSQKECNRWIISIKQTGEKIGTCGFHCLDRATQTIEAGYDLYPTYWGNGYMQEALVPAVEFAREYYRINKIEAHISVDNLASCKLVERLGFKMNGETKIYTLNGVDYIHYVYILSCAQI